MLSFINHSTNLNQASINAYQDALSFGRPGCGAPTRTRSGRIRTTLIGNPELRFQPNEGVQKSIINNIRYTADRGTKEAYQNVLGKKKIILESEAKKKRNLLIFFFLRFKKKI